MDSSPVYTPQQQQLPHQQTASREYYQARAGQNLPQRYPAQDPKGYSSQDLQGYPAQVAKAYDSQDFYPPQQNFYPDSQLYIQTVPEEPSFCLQVGIRVAVTVVVAFIVILIQILLSCWI